MINPLMPKPIAYQPIVAPKPIRVDQTPSLDLRNGLPEQRAAVSGGNRLARPAPLRLSPYHLAPESQTPKACPDDDRQSSARPSRLHPKAGLPGCWTDRSTPETTETTDAPRRADTSRSNSFKASRNLPGGGRKPFSAGPTCDASIGFVEAPPHAAEAFAFAVGEGGEALHQAAALQEGFGFLLVGGQRGQFTQLHDPTLWMAQGI